MHVDKDVVSLPVIHLGDPVLSKDKRHHIYGHFCIEDSFDRLSAKYADHTCVPIRENDARAGEARPGTSTRAHAIARAPSVSTSGAAGPPLNLNLTAMSFPLGTISNLSDNEAAVQQLLEYYHSNKSNPNLFKTSSNREPIDLQDIYDYLFLLPNKYYALGAGTYSSWIKVGWALNNTSPDLFPMWLKFSSQADGFLDSDIAELYHTWTRMQPKNDPNSALLSWKSIRYWAREANPVEAKRIYEKNIYNLVDKLFSYADFNETDVAHVLYKICGDSIVCASIKNGVWFYYENHRWKENDSGTELRGRITNELYGIVEKIYIEKREAHKTKEDAEVDQQIIANHCDETTAESSAQDDEKERENKIVAAQCKRLTTVLQYIKRTSHKNNIMVEARHCFLKSNFLECLNQDPYKIGFENGVFCFKDKQFRAGRPDDFLTLSTKMNYVPIDRTNAEDVRILEEIEEFFRQLFPDPDLCQYMWLHLASCVLGTCLQETIHIYMGKGANGKTVLTQFMKLVLGDYYGDAPVTLVTQKRVNVGNTSSEVAQLRYARYADAGAVEGRPHQRRHPQATDRRRPDERSRALPIGHHVQADVQAHNGHQQSAKGRRDRRRHLATHPRDPIRVEVHERTIRRIYRGAVQAPVPSR